MIVFENVSKKYSNCSVLDGINIRIAPQEFVSIVGRSGAGKSTLVKLLIAELKPTSGHIFVDKIDVTKIKSKLMPFYRRKIGIVFQDFKLLNFRTAYENIAFAMEVANLPHKKIKDDTMKILRIIGLEDRKDHFPAQLSGGEKQRIAIGRALALKPEILIADEPTGNLDPIHTWDIINLLVKINELGTTVVLASHDKEIINSLGKRVISLEKGRVIRDEEEGRFIV
ncbi:MAG: ATP-binding cassette domain-containing protein [Candidatus Paceibacterota bacterium]|jgi:cell division transport system ATP-binding protein